MEPEHPGTRIEKVLNFGALHGTQWHRLQVIILINHLVVMVHPALQVSGGERIRGKFVGNQPAKDPPKEPLTQPTKSNNT